MSAAEIIQQLPKLTETERRAVRNAVVELEEENEGVVLCNLVALEGAQMLDRLEEEDARRRKSG